MTGASASSEREQFPSAEERTYYETSRRVYGSWFASLYGAITAPLQGLRRRVALVAGIGPGMRVIDVATGTGAQARAFAESGASVLAIDLSPRMLAIARSKTPSSSIEYVEADATKLPAPAGSFDAACVSFALHEMPNSVRRSVIAELARVTRAGGTIVVVDYARPHNRVWRVIAEWFIALFERDAYRDFLRADLNELLARSAISVVDERRAVLDTARIIVGSREAVH
jgi:demethylmenaquinone methyltransferase/2-methoxy-6-polyprenyl-1,4-benzoquinol methylase